MSKTPTARVRKPAAPTSDVVQRPAADAQDTSEEKAATEAELKEEGDAKQGGLGDGPDLAAPDLAAPDLDGPDLDGPDLAGRVLHIRSITKEGRRRAGLAFTTEPTEVNPEDLSEDQLAQLLGDPQLVVELD